MHLQLQQIRGRTLRMGLIALLATCLPLTAQAAVSDTFALQGRLVTAGGFPVPDGDYGLTVSFYAEANSPQSVYTYLEPGVKVQKGVFVLTIGSKTKLDKTPFLAGDAGWFGLQVGSDPELPRMPLHPVPYAMRAQLAMSLACSGCLTGDMLDPSVLKDYAKSGALATIATSGAFGDLKGVPVLVAAEQTCSAGHAVAGLDGAGKVVCAPLPTFDGKNFALANQACGTGLFVTGIDAAGKPVCATGIAAGQACAAGQVVTGFDAAGKPVCAVDKVNSYTGANFALSNQACAAGLVVTGIDAAGKPVCATDKGTTYTGANFAVSSQACVAGQVVTGVDAAGKAVCAAVAQAGQACSAGSVVTGLDATGKPICAVDKVNTYTGANFAVASQTCAVGQMVKGIDGNGMVLCAADANTTYSGSNFALTNQACQTGQVVQSINADGTVKCIADANTTYSGNNFALSNQACGVGQVVTGISNSGVPTCAVDKDTTYSAGAGLGLSGTAFALAAPTASALGGVKAKTCSGTEKVVGVDTAGNVLCGAVATAPVAKTGSLVGVIAQVDSAPFGSNMGALIEAVVLIDYSTMYRITCVRASGNGVVCSALATVGTTVSNQSFFNAWSGTATVPAFTLASGAKIEVTGGLFGVPAYISLKSTAANVIYYSMTSY